MGKFYIKSNRIFTTLRKYAWLFILLVAFGGLWYPKLGLLMIPVMISLALIGFFKGKYWCGNLCPHGSLFDYIIMPISFNRNIPGAFKSNITKTLAFAWFSYMLVQRLAKVFTIFGTAPFLDKLGFIFVMNYLVVTILGTILAIFISPRAWCSFCPMGTMEVLSYKLGKLLKLNQNSDEKITAKRAEMCHTCAKCVRVCPMQLTPYQEFSEKNQFDNEACIRCSTCVENCPAGILSLCNEDQAIKLKNITKIDGYENRQKIIARLEKINKLSDDISEFTFKFTKPKKVDYEAGQFILVKIQDSPEIFRAYSISSYNENGTEISVTIKKLEDGYGTNIIFNNFKVGDMIELEGPMGRELLVDKNADKVLLIAGGIGITPFVPIVRDITENKKAVENVKLIYGVNTPNEFIYDQEFSNFAKENEKFEYIKVVAFDDKWQGKKGFVTDVIKDMDLTDYKIYMCGSLPMINATLNVLGKLGVKEENIFFESA